MLNVIPIQGTSSSAGDADEVEVTDELIVPNGLTLSLEDLSSDGGPTVGSSQERLQLLGQNGRVTRDELAHDATEGFDTEGEGSDVEQKNITDATGQDGTLDNRTDGNDLVRVDTSTSFHFE